MRKSFVLMLALMVWASVYAAPQWLDGGKVKMSGKHPSLVTGIQIPLKADPAVAKSFIAEKFLPSFSLGKNVDLKLSSRFVDGKNSIFRFSSTYKGVKVENGSVTVAVKNGKIYRITNSIGKIDLDLSNLVSEKSAVANLLNIQGAGKLNKLPLYHAQKLIIKVTGRYVPVYKIRFQPVMLGDSRYYYVHAGTGDFLFGGNETSF